MEIELRKSTEKEKVINKIKEFKELKDVYGNNIFSIKERFFIAHCMDIVNKSVL